MLKNLTELQKNPLNCKILNFERIYKIAKGFAKCKIVFKLNMSSPNYARIKEPTKLYKGKNSTFTHSLIIMEIPVSVDV